MHIELPRKTHTVLEKEEKAPLWGEYFMSNGAKFRVQIQRYFLQLIIVTLKHLCLIDSEHYATTSSRISIKRS